MAGTKLWIGNIEPGTTDDELREFVKKYSPDLEIEAIQRVEGDGSIRPHATNRTETLECGLVLRSIGYRGVALEGVPFDERKAVIPNAQGRIVDPQTEQFVLVVRPGDIESAFARAEDTLRDRLTAMLPDAAPDGATPIPIYRGVP